ncbi:hypothetical protein V6Z11_D13G162700 [Gossypium hirsutum]
MIEILEKSDREKKNTIKDTRIEEETVRMVNKIEPIDGVASIVTSMQRWV